MISSSSDESCPAPWLRDMRKALTQVFRLNSFRTHQQQIISSAIQGKDVFVLMPTGGGKSLCYQLPAILQNHAPGVSIVVSPLLSLMQDQVHDLVCVKGIAAALLNSQMGAAHRRWVYSELKKPSSLMCLLYVTPEMLEKSKELVEALSCLYDQDRLTRFVIDEAHCVSQWGHDFRPDYKLLGNVRNRFSGVPIMALTATATPTVEADVLRCLGMQECKVFRQSFNRKNLSLEVVTKTPRSMADDIYQFIDDGRRNHSGIIYCIGRQQCESLAEELREAFGLTAEHYHAKLTPDMRNNVQREWKEGRIRIIVATIAFGMGIDKPDVRYVIHASIPSSLEGYYQEIGRAGRDGQPAVCRLYYTYRDASVHRGQIDRGGGNSTQKERLNTNLNAMIAYCENVIDCRRFLVLKYFGETFDASGCNQTCDNCLGAMNQTNITKDMTSLAIETIRLVRSVQSAGVTLLQVLDMLRGSQSKRFVDNGFLEATSYGAGKHLSRPDAERFMKHLVIMGILVEKTEYNNMGFSSAYLKVRTP
ncbi:P-loop containing nucleoside triphosphate hydrolase protein [Phycomyces blakesleeanus]|uniref:ATP-dependent DNA helicase n=1 Tax=Phycomyces blakesleeanus TaxID=4837 RepID=A0ABR3B8R7_PHYBL